LVTPPLPVLPPLLLPFPLPLLEQAASAAATKVTAQRRCPRGAAAVKILAGTAGCLLVCIVRVVDQHPAVKAQPYRRKLLPWTQFAAASTSWQFRSQLRYPNVTKQLAIELEKRDCTNERRCAVHVNARADGPAVANGRIDRRSSSCCAGAIPRRSTQPAMLHIKRRHQDPET
jgi:hypothetical protein